mmetsp:Transcript_72461/g.121447  ORF Transcript_72461/g.121447 Transcript_72461/m.121447 type:complete len:231 (+) Transcript_72461:108-800(+)
MCELDPTNAYWSIKLPRRWHRTFVVRGGQRRWRFTRLPFRCKYSPAIYQRLFAGIVARALRGTDTDWDVYLDDILITARHPWEARQGAQRVAEALQGAGFITGPKSELEPATCITFLGKRLDSIRRSISNSVDMLKAALRMWLRGVGTGHMPAREMARFLGRLQWVFRPLGGGLSLRGRGLYCHAPPLPRLWPTSGSCHRHGPPPFLPGPRPAHTITHTHTHVLLRCRLR